jgi:Fur family transcriptional regulator, ferric uptake regulator
MDKTFPSDKEPQRAVARNTPVRRALLDLLEQAREPLTAAEILEALAARALPVNKTTVYRQLDILTEEGRVNMLAFGMDGKRYETNRGEAHPHLLCTRCGHVECLPSEEELETYQQRIAAEHGFSAQRCSLEVYGICDACQKGTD